MNIPKQGDRHVKDYGACGHENIFLKNQNIFLVYNIF